jgi:hypothetical protein
VICRFKQARAVPSASQDKRASSTKRVLIGCDVSFARNRFFEVVEVSDSLDEEARERLLKRWEEELADYTSAFIGRSLTEWLEREDQVILF